MPPVYARHQVKHKEDEDDDKDDNTHLQFLFVTIFV
jgi:hypothetical protein